MKRFKTITEFLGFRGLPKPAHPLIYVLELKPIEALRIAEPVSWLYDFYCIGLKRVANAKEVRLKYGQQLYDYNEGLMTFVAPNQVLSLSVNTNTDIINQSGWVLLIHPDFLWNTPLAKNIRQYDFWDYSVHEALFLSEKEEATLVSILHNIQHECQANLDKFTKQIIVAQVESFLSYADRFYHRQFITREKASHQILEKLETWLNNYFDSNNVTARGLPTVEAAAYALNISAKYLSSLLKVLTGMNTQQHIHEKLVEKAKEQLSTTNLYLSVSEIAYGLGFEHLPSFSKLFKAKTQLSPQAFRSSFNN